MIKLILVDDHDMVRNALASFLEKDAGLQVVGMAGCAGKAWELLSSQDADVVVTDLDLPGQNGQQLSLRILEKNPAQGIVILSYRVDAREVLSLVEAGVRGYVPKSSSVDELVRAIRLVAAGRDYFAGQASAALAEAVRNKDPNRLNLLSERHSTILQKISLGLTTRQIAEELSLSPKTVEKYRSQILRRLNCKNLIQALEAARKLHILGPT
ncbi:response regulator transcription factor [bacterium]|nr:response regulator transcription factor [bacterium]